MKLTVIFMQGYSFDRLNTKMLKLLIFHWLWVTTVAGRTVPGEIYSALAHVQRLFQFDQKVGPLLLQLSADSPETQRYIELYKWSAIDAYVTSNGDLSNSLEILTGNPLHVYALMKRFVLYWPIVHQHLYKAGHVDEVSRWLNETILPSERDLRGTALALGRLQLVYNLPVEELVGGTILHRRCSVRLTIYDCLRIAHESQQDKIYISSWMWYYYALENTDDLDQQDYIRRLMRQMAQEHDAQQYKSNEQSFPLSLVLYPHQDPPVTDYFHLCRGLQSFPTVVEQSRLKCYVTHRDSPYLLVQPIRYEELRTSPELYLYHDVVSNEQIQIIQNIAEDNLKRAGVVSITGPSESRIAQTAWLTNDTHPVLVSLSRRISYMTGLHVYEGVAGKMAGEQLQVQSYGVGGHYLLHYDPVYKSNPPEMWSEAHIGPSNVADGDRLATLMIYMSDVEAGGRTAFGSAGVSVAPVKGGAAFWYNVNRDGTLDHNTLHAGCPVLLGHKWAANKWIRENANFMRRPCTRRTKQVQKEVKSEVAYKIDDDDDEEEEEEEDYYDDDEYDEDDSEDLHKTWQNQDFDDEAKQLHDKAHVNKGNGSASPKKEL